MKAKFERPIVLTGYTIRADTPCGGFYLTLNECNNKLCEVRMTLGKSGTCFNIMFQTIGILLSVMLQEGIPKEKIKKTLYNQFGGHCGQTIWQDGIRYHSCIDYAISKILEDMASRGEITLEEKEN